MTTPIKIRTVSCEKFDMDYFRFGSGSKPFVIIPGLSLKSVMLSADAVADAYSLFSEEFTVYVFDRKKNVPYGYTILDMTDDTAEAMKKLGIKDACIFGASMGGMITMCLELKYPELVSKAVLGSTSARLGEKAVSVMSYWRSLCDSGDIRTLIDSFYEHLFSDEYLDRYRELINSMPCETTEEERTAFSALSSSIIGFDLYDQLDKIKKPTLVIGSKNDKVFSGEENCAVARKISCGVYMYEQYGHAVYDEAPDYRERLINFFRGE